MAEAVQTDARKLPYVAAITEGIRTVMSEQDNAFIAGEDVAGAGGVYGYYAGILKEFGPERVFDTPISEEGIVGLGVGSAATGCTAQTPDRPPARTAAAQTPARLPTD